MYNAGVRMTRIFFSCDPHGNELVWKKYLRMAGHYKADVIVLSGDLTGKAIVPIIKKASGEWYSCPYGEVKKYYSKKEVEREIQSLRREAFYAVEITQEEAEEFQKDEKKMDNLFIGVMKETLDRWLSMVEEQVPKNVKVVVNPGNDDHFAIDDVIKRHDGVIYPLGKVVDIDEKHPMISCAWVNTTPWDTPRECSEKDLMKKLEKEFRRVADHENLICNFHAPPFGTLLDIAPKLTKDLRVIMDFGRPVMEPVGSKAVREAILKYQPLLSLHGHIHEASAHCNLGRTVCVNPGSDYRKGALRGYVIDLPTPEKPEVECWRVVA